MSESRSFRKIAAILERSPSTISREVKRNKAKFKPHRKTGNKFWYNHWRAQNLYTRCRREQYRAALKPYTAAWDYIASGLNRFWSPEEIGGRWRRTFPDRKPLCVSAIYRYIKAGKFPAITAKTHLRRRGKRMLLRNSNYNSAQPDRIIPQRPEEIRGRLRVGLLTSRTAKGTRPVIEKLLEGLPVKSVSLDNGSEFSEFRKLEESLSALVYFAEPHKPWQRGTNENTNDIIRFFSPKGFDFRTVTEDDVRLVEELINTRRSLFRRCCTCLTFCREFTPPLPI